MADENVTVAVTAEAAPAQDALKDVAQSVKDLKEQVTSIAAGAASFKDAFIKAFTIDKILEFTSAMMESASAVERLTASLGVSAQTIDTFDFAGRSAGVSVTTMSEMMTRLETNMMRANAGVDRSQAAFSNLGLKTRDFIGLNAEQKFDLLAERISRFRDGTEKTAAVQALLGNGAAALIPILNQGAGAFDEYAEASKRAGSAATPEFLAEMARLEATTNELGKSLAAVGQSIITILSPALSGTARVFADLVQNLNLSITQGGFFKGVLDGIAAALKIVATAVSVVSFLLQELFEIARVVAFSVSQAFITMGAVIKNAVTLNLSGAKEAFADFGNQMSARLKTSGSNIETLYKQMANQITTTWKEATVNEGKITQDRNVRNDQLNRDRMNATLRAYEGEIRAAQDLLRQKASVLDFEVSTYRITQNQKFGLLQKFTEEAYQEQMRALQAELTIGGLKAAQVQEINNRIRSLQTTHNTEMINLDRQSIQAQTAMWRQYTDTVAGAFNSQMRGLITGQLSFAQAFKNVLLDLSLKTIELLVTKPVAEYIAGQLAILTANQTGAATRAATEIAATEAALPAKIASFTSDLTARAALTFAGIFANLSPLLGPAAAGPAAAGEATVLAQLAAVPKFDVGSWSVPRTGLAMIHKDEVILPAGAPAEAYRSGQTSGGGSVQVNFNIQAMDAGSVKAWLASGGAAQIANAVAAYQDKNPSARPKR